MCLLKKLIRWGCLSAPAPAEEAFTPNSISGLIHWGKTDSLTANDGDLIDTLADSSSSGYTQTASGTERPTYKTGIANGQPALLFNGSTNKMRNASVAAQGTGPFSFAMVVRPTAFGAVYRNMYTLGSAAINKAMFPVVFNAQVEYGKYGGPFLITGTTLSIPNVYVVLCRSDGSTFYSYVNGAATPTPTAVPPYNLDVAGLTIGAGTGFAQHWQGYIFEWVMYDGCITTDDIADLQTYFAAKYGI